MPELRSIAELAARAFDGARATWRSQLTSATVLDQIRHPDEPVPAFTFDELRVLSANDLERMAELERSPRERRADPGRLPAVAQTYTDLADRVPREDPRRAALLALAASTWSVAGYQANSVALARQYRRQIDYQLGHNPVEAVDIFRAAPAGIAALTAAVLLRDVHEVGRLGAAAEESLPALGRRAVSEVGQDPLDLGDAAVLAAYGLAGRAARRLAHFWLTGNRHSGTEARMLFRQAADLLLPAGVVDTWSLLDNLAHVVEDLIASSPWRLLRRARSWNDLWDRYLRWLARDEHPVTQVWPSQRRVLDAELICGSRPNLVVTMPTSAGKTNIAEWAILDAVSDGGVGPLGRPLVVYVVPTRALAGEVESKLTRTLGRVGLAVSAVFGGWEQVQYELQLIAHLDVLVVTSEKLDLLLRNDESIADRLSLVVVDEGHLIGEGERGLRLEMVLTRLRITCPKARVLLLSAVLPNGDEVGRWVEPDLDGRNTLKENWTPSTVRVGVFSWSGPERDGQRGVVRYRNDDVDHGFFLPYVITRRKKRKRLYPTDPKDVAAELALHYERIGSVLVAAPIKASARAVARVVDQLVASRSIDLCAEVDPSRRARMEELRDAAADAVREYAGSGHELEQFIRAGIAYHHSDVPEAVRHAIEDAYRGGALRVLCATSTLGQGVNLPAKTVIISGTHRNKDDEITVRDFWNTAGRAARPFQETDGHVILVATSNTNQQRQRYVDNPKFERVTSTIYQLYLALVMQRLPAARSWNDVPEDFECPDPALDEHTRLADALDLQMLTLLAEEVVDTDDEQILEEAVGKTIGATLGAAQLSGREAPVRPLVRFASRRTRALAARVPDQSTRQAFIKTGLSLAGCESAMTAAEAIHHAILEDPELLTRPRASELLALVLEGTVGVTELIEACAKVKVPVDRVPALASDWIAGKAMDDLRRAHAAGLGVDDPMAFTAVLDRVVVNTLAWVVSSIVQLLEHLLGAALPGPVALAAAMTKYGVGTETACFATTIGIRRRSDAQAVGHAYPGEPADGLVPFITWAAGLEEQDLQGLVSENTLALFTEKAAAMRTPDGMLAVIRTGTGTFEAPIRGIRHAGSAARVAALHVGDPVELRRERDNPADPNAVSVCDLAEGNHLGYLAREAARILAPMMDVNSEQAVAAVVAQVPDPGDGHVAVESFDVVTLKITVGG